MLWLQNFLCQRQRKTNKNGIANKPVVFTEYRENSSFRIYYEPIPATDKENMCRKILQKDTLYLITLVFDQGPNKQIKTRGLLFIIV